MILFSDPKTRDVPHSPGSARLAANFCSKSWPMRGFHWVGVKFIRRSGIDVDRFDYMVRDCYHVCLIAES